MEQLLECGRVAWYQQVEGQLTELLEFSLPASESRDKLLAERGNTVSYWQVLAANYFNQSCTAVCRRTTGTCGPSWTGTGWWWRTAGPRRSGPSWCTSHPRYSILLHCQHNPANF